MNSIAIIGVLVVLFLGTSTVSNSTNVTTTQAPNVTTTQATNVTTIQVPNVTTTQAPNVTTTQATNVTTIQATNVTTTQASTTSAKIATTPVPSPKPEPDESNVKIEYIARIKDVEYSDELKNETSEKGTKFRKQFKEACIEAVPKAKDCPIKNITNGSVIVIFDVVLPAETSLSDVVKIADVLKKQVQSGKFGNFTTDTTYIKDVYIITKVKASEVLIEPTSTEDKISTTLLIVLGVALFLLLVVSIVLIVVIVFLLKIKKKKEMI